jgi:hypothetical protein
VAKRDADFTLAGIAIQAGDAEATFAVKAMHAKCVSVLCPFVGAGPSFLLSAFILAAP